ncbi:hypothetical protein SODALDRAFT_355158 [Sodiomyces alkalinus F11]|uniref:Uncharacterized protein n=1 Tax=Sodiomyces alkalinus (strain CBS 110278 / VKM F-3762 / F11) TaxID=1314773 RepID=A0A3N2Q865_SODAK|nr:hypothetical protein SODALDRAFT_355158 [Sodiomyces alkalinus F11]ROT42971.1 hypothetical protein SODALDRAFT_355158 [Sodiomyces alkalinus F11]
MVSTKLFLTITALALHATAHPSLLAPNTALGCVAPSNCSPIGGCQFCCSKGIKPNSFKCHSHGDKNCGSLNHRSKFAYTAHSLRSLRAFMTPR